MNLFFLAAGMGSRLKPLTEKYPKPCVPFLNVPLGLYNFRFIDPSSATHCVANTFHLPEKIHDLYKNQNYFSTPFAFSDEAGFILGGAGGLKKAAPLFDLKETILLMNADEVYFPKDKKFIDKALKRHTENNNLATLICMEHPEAGSKFGAIWCDGIKIKEVGKIPKDPSLKPFHFIGMILIHPRLLAGIPLGIEANIFSDAIFKQLDHDHAEVFSISTEWFETGNPQDYFEATKWSLQNLQPDTLAFINSYDPSRVIKNSGGLSLVSNSIQVDESKLFGFNVIAKSTNPKTLQSLGRIENSVLFENEVLNYDYFKNSIMA